jgi:hypothetical protein
MRKQSQPQSRATILVGGAAVGGAGVFNGGGNSGGAGCNSGGGGGTSFAEATATNVAHTWGVQSGNGQVVISW